MCSNVIHLLFDRNKRNILEIQRELEYYKWKYKRALISDMLPKEKRMARINTSITKIKELMNELEKEKKI